MISACDSDPLDSREWHQTGMQLGSFPQPRPLCPLPKCSQPHCSGGHQQRVGAWLRATRLMVTREEAAGDTALSLPHLEGSRGMEPRIPQTGTWLLLPWLCPP